MKIEILKEHFKPITPFMEHYKLLLYPNGKEIENYKYSYQDFSVSSAYALDLKYLMWSYGVYWQDKGVRMERQRLGIIF